jgi:anti-anti-sigma factor
MEYTVEESGTIFAARLKGELSFVDHQRFRDLLDKMKDSKRTVVVLNVHGVSSIDSAGIGMLLIAAEQAAASSQSFSVDKPCGQVEKMLDISNLEKIFSITH